MKCTQIIKKCIFLMQFLQLLSVMSYDDVFSRLSQFCPSLSLSFSFSIWRNYFILWLGLNKPSTRRCNFIHTNSKFNRLLKANFASTANSWRKFEALCDWWMLREEVTGRKNTHHWLGLVIREGVCRQSLFAKCDVFVLKRCFLEVKFRLIGSL